jgi:YcaO-like protein with predicted kinase domain
LPTVCAIRPAALTLTVAAGKGLSLEAAKVSAAMEAIEFFSAESTPVHEVQCSYRELPHAAVMSLEDYAPYPTDVPLSWTVGMDLMSGKPRFVPSDLVTLRGQNDRLTPFPVTSHGLGAGAVLVEAILVALLEVIERSAVRSWRNPPRVAPDSLRERPLARKLIEQIGEGGAEIAIYDCQSDVGIPVYFARLWDAREAYAGVYSGSGAHLDREIAVVRAITEAAQSRAVYIAGARDDLSTRAFVQHRAHASPSILERLRSQPAIAQMRDARDCANETFEDDLGYLLARLETTGRCECIVVDLTPSEFRGIVSVTRVVIPGLAA